MVIQAKYCYHISHYYERIKHRRPQRKKLLLFVCPHILVFLITALGHVVLHTTFPDVVSDDAKESNPVYPFSECPHGKVGQKARHHREGGEGVVCALVICVISRLVI